MDIKPETCPIHWTQCNRAMVKEIEDWLGHFEVRGKAPAGLSIIKTPKNGWFLTNEGRFVAGFCKTRTNLLRWLEWRRTNPR